jgi:hypothetical protein
MRGAYVAVLRVVARIADLTGLTRLLDAWARRSRWGLWARSLLAIYDPVALIRLDVPWWTFEAGDRVAERLRERPATRVFEWGAGASTVWLGTRAASVHSVEHDTAWAEDLTGLLPSNATVVAVPPEPATSATTVRSAKKGFEGLDFGRYVEAINETTGEFDLIVVDGRAREACLFAALPRLAEDGLIVFDNVDRERYVEAIAELGPAFQVTWTRGLTPCLPYPTRTALIARAGGTGQ